MKYFISDLIVGMKGAVEFSDWVDSLKNSEIGIEFSAFTHDDSFWNDLSQKVPALTCPISFHGPYVKIEATSDLGSAEHKWLMQSYDKVLRLAAVNHVRHVVFHYSQLQFDPTEIPVKQKNAYQVMKDLTAIANHYGAPLVIENLCRQPNKTHLFTNEEYFQIFETIPEAYSLIDIGHANVNGLDVEKFLALYGSRVKGFHVHNNDGKLDQHLDYHNGTADIRQIMKWIGKYVQDADIVLEYEPHEKLSHAELLEELSELKGWIEE